MGRSGRCVNEIELTATQTIIGRLFSGRGNRRGQPGCVPSSTLAPLVQCRSSARLDSFARSRWGAGSSSTLAPLVQCRSSARLDSPRTRLTGRVRTKLCSSTTRAVSLWCATCCPANQGACRPSCAHVVPRQPCACCGGRGCGVGGWCCPVPAGTLLYTSPHHQQPWPVVHHCVGRAGVGVLRAPTCCQRAADVPTR